MRILLTGATGNIGQKIAHSLHKIGHDLIIITRNEKKAKETLQIPAVYLTISKISKKLGPVDVVINLAGESIDGRWTPQSVREFYRSRVQTTKQLLDQLKLSEIRPKRLISTSATGYYGHQMNRTLTEKSLSGSGILSEVCNTWEYMAKHRVGPSTEVVILRLGMVMDHQSGFFPRMLKMFKSYLGGVIGTGDQYWSWVHMDDVVRAYLFFLTAPLPEKNNIYNVVAEPVTNKIFTKDLALKLNVWAIFSMPAIFLEFFIGKKTQLLVNSQKVSNEKILKSGFKLNYGTLDLALEKTLAESDKKEE